MVGDLLGFIGVGRGDDGSHDRQLPAHVIIGPLKVQKGLVRVVPEQTLVAVDGFDEGLEGCDRPLVVHLSSISIRDLRGSSSDGPSVARAHPLAIQGAPKRFSTLAP